MNIFFPTRIECDPKIKNFVSQQNFDKFEKISTILNFTRDIGSVEINNDRFILVDEKDNYIDYINFNPYREMNQQIVDIQNRALNDVFQELSYKENDIKEFKLEYDFSQKRPNLVQISGKTSNQDFFYVPNNNTYICRNRIPTK